MEVPARVMELCSYLADKGLRPLLVGGAVIDVILGNDPKDWDIEVHGCSLDDLQATLEAGGFKCKTAGKSFGILVVGNMDVSVPRRDNKTGKGHKGFKVEFDPTMTPEDAARRRDFTINSMYYDVVTGEIVDPFNGMQDLRDGILRATDPVHFVEDPLRAFRAMQLLARKAKTVEPATLELIRGMVDAYPELPPERTYEEFRKLLLKAKKPSVGLELLRESGWIVHFPELHALIGCPQNPEYHPEGDVWVHTLKVVDAAAQLRPNIPRGWRIAFMFAALLHDIGKPSTTKEDFTAHGHDSAGWDMARDFMRRMKASKPVAAKVGALVGYHMRPRQLYKGGAKLAAWKRLHNKCRLDVLGYLSHADSSGVGFDRSVEDENPKLQMCLDYFEKLGEEPVKPVLMGRHLIAAGMEPGPQFQHILKRGYEIQLENPELTAEELLGRMRGD
jgi:tRNA nucleotidyltransferase (CCA-adding enzyme)